MINLLNGSKNQIKTAIQDLANKFEEFEVPVVGKIPVGLANAVILYPVAVGVGSLICSYYLAQTISKRLNFQKKLKSYFDRELYPVWVDPSEPKKVFRYGRLMLFISLPLIILVLISYFLYSSPVKQISTFGINADSLLHISLYMGFVLTIIGIILILNEDRRNLKVTDKKTGQIQTK